MLRSIRDMIELKEDCVKYLLFLLWDIQYIGDKTLPIIYLKEIYVTLPYKVSRSHGDIGRKIGWRTLYTNIFKI
jgi:hypothetical protein